MLYFDHNATTPLLPAARQAWLEAAEKFFGNPSSPHRLGARADAALTQARAKLAAGLGCDPLDLVWTSGATESNNTVFHHCARSLPAKTEVWVSAIEHPCVLDAAANYFKGRLRLIPVRRNGIIDFDWLTAELAEGHPGLIALMAANNETGVVQPWREVLAVCREWKIPFFCDAAQWIGKMPAKGLGDCDFVSGCAHKFGGPKGVGFLKCPARGRVQPLFRGGKQEEGRRAGTENVAGVLSMIAAFEAREARMNEAEMHDAECRMQHPSTGRSCLDSSSSSRSSSSKEVALRLAWRNAFEKRLLKTLPGAEIVGDSAPRLWNTVSALMPAADCQQRWVVKLDKLGFAVSTGSACASGREEPSPVLAAMGCSSAEAGRMLRFSSGWETTEEDWDALAEGLVKVHHAMQPVQGRMENRG